jgi:hypothetical protein
VTVSVTVSTLLTREGIGGLLSVVGQNIYLSVEGISNAQVTQVVSGFKTESTEEGKFSVALGDMQSEEVVQW